MKFPKKTLLGIILPLLFLLIWEVWAVKLDNPALIPKIEAVLMRLFSPFTELVGTGSLAWNTGISIFRVLCGFSIAVLVCVPLGLLMGTSETVNRIVHPFVELFRPLCPIAWIPFAMAVFRTTTVSQFFGIRYSNTILDNVQLGMLFIIFYGGAFPVLLNPINGVSVVRTL